MAFSARNGSLVVCPPGPSADWCYGVIETVASLAGVPVHRLATTDIINPEGIAGVYICQVPSASAIEAVREGHLDAILVVQDPNWNVSYAMQNGATLLDALRPLSASMTANLAIGSTSRSRLLFPGLQDSAATTARRLLISAGLPSNRAVMDAAAHVVGNGHHVDAPLADVIWNLSTRGEPPQLSAEMQDIVAKVTAGIMAMAQGDRSSPVIWPRDVYLLADRPNEPVPEFAEVTGPARNIVYGPYLHLPPAKYLTEIIVSFAGRIEDIPFLLELYAGSACIARFRLAGRKSGDFRGRFEVSVVDPAAPIEVRLRSERGAIEGEMAFVGSRFYAAADEDKVFS